MTEKSIVSSSSEIQNNAELAEFFKLNANAGSDNLAGSLPQLKVTEANSQNEELDGQYAPAGTFYYAPEKTSYKELNVSILAISRGFYALDNSDNPKPKYTQLVGGMILDTMQPFIMFVSGTRLDNMWEFGKEIRPLTKSKTSPIPMFTLQVKLTLEQIATDYGRNHIVKYSVVRGSDKKPLIISDIETLKILRSNIDSVEDMFSGFIDQKEVDKNTGDPLSQEDKFVHESVVQDGGKAEEAAEVLGGDVVEANQIDSEVDTTKEIPF